MALFPARFVWYDVMTTDTKAAAAFYKAVIGWDATEMGSADRPYTVFSAGPAMAAGLMPIPKEACAEGAKPCWTGYIGVDDVDAYAARVTSAGGKVLRAPEDIPGVGRFALAADPHGAHFILFKGMGEAPDQGAAPDAPGRVGWHELHAGDREEAFAFYSGLFNWTKADAVDMGPMGIYQIFAAGGAPCGGMMTRMPETPGPFWLYYFTVDSIQSAMARVIQNGGQAINGPHEVPGGSWIVQCLDPQGAMFAMVSANR